MTDTQHPPILGMLAERLNYRLALERIARFDLTRERSGVNVVVLQEIARGALYGEEAAFTKERS